MTNAFNLAPRNALEKLGKSLPEAELLTYHTFVAAMLDEGVGGLPETDLLLASHREGVARAVLAVKAKKINQAERKRLETFATNALRTVSSDGAAYVIEAWAAAFGKSVSIAAKPQKKVQPPPPRPKTPTPKATPAKAAKNATPNAWKIQLPWKMVADISSLLGMCLVIFITVGIIAKTMRHRESDSSEASQLTRPEVSRGSKTSSPTGEATPIHKAPSDESFKRKYFPHYTHDVAESKPATTRKRQPKRRDENGVPEGYVSRWYPNDPRSKYKTRSGPYLPPQGDRISRQIANGDR